MSKLILLACASILLPISAGSDREQFAKYRAFEAFEVRPGILMMPRYSGDGQVCEAVIERHHYVGGAANLDSTLPREVILTIVDEIVPVSERGSLLTPLGQEYLSLVSGNGSSTFAEYTNVSINIFGQTAPTCCSGDIVAVIRWKNRKCQ